MFKFSIRDVLWLTLVVGLALGWLVHYRALESRHARRSEYISRLKYELGMSIGRTDALLDALGKTFAKNVDWSILSGRGDLPPDLENEP
jgi:hypothetical protein